jgi:hypothetical protein
MPGELAILAVGHGDTKLTFDPKKPDEAKRSAQIVEDMIKRGYVILIEVGQDDQGEPLYRRAHGFDAKVSEYIVAGDPIPTTEEASHEQEPTGAPRPSRKAAPRAGRGRTTHRVPASGAKAVAVARTAGG